MSPTSTLIIDLLEIELFSWTRNFSGKNTMQRVLSINEASSKSQSRLPIFNLIKNIQPKVLNRIFGDVAPIPKRTVWNSQINFFL